MAGLAVTATLAIGGRAAHAGEPPRSDGPPVPFAATPAPPGGGLAGALWRAMARQFDQASEARVPPPRPPVAVPVKWKARRVAALDLGAALLAMAAGDLDGDGRAEVVALTERHLVVLRPAGRNLAEVARLALPAEPASIRPRDPVGTVVVVEAAAGQRGQILARASSVGRGARYQFDGKRVTEVGPLSGFPLCADDTGELVPGRNYFASAPGAAGPTTEAFLVRRCRTGLVDAAGRALRVRAQVMVRGPLTIDIEVRCPVGDTGCQAHQALSLARAGVALAVDDVDHDGHLDVIISGAGAPGDADAVAVYEAGPAGLPRKPSFRRAFSGGVVALCSGDVDGDGDRDVFAAVRLTGTRKVDLWLLD